MPARRATGPAAAQRGPGRALDLGAGEGADAIRLARLGDDVDAFELSAVACEKAERFARAEGVRMNVRCEPIETASLEGTYDVVLMNGCLHYVSDKNSVALLRFYERDREEHSHPGFAPHAHSHIKLIAARQPERNGAR